MIEVNKLTEQIIGSAIEVHRTLGPGLLESSYELCLEREFVIRSIPHKRQIEIPLSYKGIELKYTYRLDFLVGECIVVELKAVDLLLPIHEAQMLSYLRLGKWKVGLLINFHVPRLTLGIKRIVLNFNEK